MEQIIFYLITIPLLALLVVMMAPSIAPCIAHRAKRMTLADVGHGLVLACVWIAAVGVLCLVQAVM